MDPLREVSEYPTPEVASLNAFLDKTQLTTIATLSQFRFAVLSRASLLMNGGAALAASSEAYEDLVRLLMTSLEGLRIAEEELRAQNAALAERQSLVDASTRHYRELFLRAPMPMLVTDLHGTILEANVAAANLLKHEAAWLERKQLAGLIHMGHRAEFRNQFARFSPDDGARDWRLWINRHADVPIEVRATVKRIEGSRLTESGVLCWMFGDAARAFDEP